jgi:three-Cys-motif partner protein
MANQNFFDERLEQSQIKAEIVSRYFWVWAKIIMATMKAGAGRNKRIAYIDLFAGPGRYMDGTQSTPVMILEKAVRDPEMSQMLVTMFNDVNSDNTASLEATIKLIPNIEKLKYKPLIYNNEVGDNIVQMFEQTKLIPTLFFVDPWGYKGLSLRLINSVLKDWGCDCIFFFNYNRINMGLNNEDVEDHMNALFGEDRAKELRTQLDGLDSKERELTIVNELAQALKKMGGKFVLPFRFRNEAGSRTSHHLIFVSKHFKGYEVMKDVMARESSTIEQGVASFEYSPASERQPLLFAFRPRPIDELKGALLKDFAGRTLTMENTYEIHSIDTPYTRANYKEALKQLEAEGKIIADPPADKRRKIKGEISFGDAVKVTFL